MDHKAWLNARPGPAARLARPFIVVFLSVKDYFSGDGLRLSCARVMAVSSIG
jgi:hypothetical protein